MKTKRSILFICTGNSCRSQMAEGFAKTMLPVKWKVLSAGTIASSVHPLAIDVMKEVNIDISSQYSKTVNEIPIDEIDYVVTLCGDARDRCPVFPNALLQEHWPIEDPIYATGSPDAMKVFRQVRDDIKQRMEDLAKQLSKLSHL
ncbi:MAG: arsenate reductase ArsC [Pseudomonadota bacterium]